MLDDSFCCLRSLIYFLFIKIDRIPKDTWMPESLHSVVWWWSYMHTNVYAVHACGCSLSVTCQVAMVIQ